MTDPEVSRFGALFSFSSPLGHGIATGLSPNRHDRGAGEAKTGGRQVHDELEVYERDEGRRLDTRGRSRRFSAAAAQDGMAAADARRGSGRRRALGGGAGDAFDDAVERRR